MIYSSCWFLFIYDFPLNFFFFKNFRLQLPGLFRLGFSPPRPVPHTYKKLRLLDLDEWLQGNVVITISNPFIPGILSLFSSCLHFVCLHCKYLLALYSWLFYDCVFHLLRTHQFFVSFCPPSSILQDQTNHFSTL